MANIATVHVRLFAGFGPPREGRWPGLSHVEILGILTSPYSGNTYVAPLGLAYAEGGYCLDIHYGAKGTPSTGPENLWARRDEGNFAAIWVRFDDSGGDDDWIYSFDERGESEWRVCRYEAGLPPSWETCLDEGYQKSIVDFIALRTKSGGA